MTFSNAQRQDAVRAMIQWCSDMHVTIVSQTPAADRHVIVYRDNGEDIEFVVSFV